MQRFLREIRNESEEYRGGAVRVEAQSQELAKQFRDLKQSVNQTLLVANKPPSPRAIRHSQTSRPIKTTTLNTGNKYTAPNTTRTKRSGSLKTPNKNPIQSLDSNGTSKRRDSTPPKPQTTSRKIVIDFPEKLSDI